ncbi:MAG: hypothetical protein MJA84_10340 [Firmicutes bacterium]|nr:hypothetical protein [Bacillota bacterium]
MFIIDTVLLQALFTVLLLIIVDALLGLALALREGTFKLSEAPRFLRTEILPYYTAILALAGMSMIEDIHQLGMKSVTWTVIAIYTARILFTEIRQKLVKLFKINPDELPSNKAQSG